jgi:hypothetical protein
MFDQLLLRSGKSNESATCTLTAAAAAANQLITELVEGDTFSYST